MKTGTRHGWFGYALHVLAPVVLILAGCATQPGSPGSGFSTPELAGTRWIVTSIDGRAPVRGPSPTADFGQDGRINGDAGCNSFSGPFIQTGTTVQFGELLSTRRACVDADRQQQETRLLDILQGPTTVRLNRDRLTVRGAAGSVVLTQSEPVTLGYQQ